MSNDLSSNLDYVSISVAAHASGVRREYVYRWVKQGKIRSFTFQATPDGKRKILVLLEDVLAYKDSI